MLTAFYIAPPQHVILNTKDWLYICEAILVDVLQLVVNNKKTDRTWLAT